MQYTDIVQVNVNVKYYDLFSENIIYENHNNRLY